MHVPSSGEMENTSVSLKSGKKEFSLLLVCLVNLYSVTIYAECCGVEVQTKLMTQRFL